MFRKSSFSNLVQRLLRRHISLPFVTGYAEFFLKYLDLKQFPLAVQNIAIVEELIECRDQYFVESWVDENGVCSTYTTSTELFCNQKEDIITGYVVPQFTLKEHDNVALIRTAEDIAIRIGLRNTFFNVELWKIGGEFKVVEINSRCVSTSSGMYTRMYDLSNYEAAISLACGEKESIPKKPASTMYKVGEEITGYFYVLTYEGGKAKDLMDFDYAKNGSKADGAYNNQGTGVELTVAEETIVMKSATRGSMLCAYMITTNNPSELFDKMRKVRKKLLLCNDHPDLCIIEPTLN